MGTDLYFTLVDKESKKTLMNLASFGNYTPLKDYGHFNFTNIGNYEYIVKESDIKILIYEIEKVTTILFREFKSINEIIYCDEYGYPRKLMKELYCYPFSPAEDLFSGLALIRLYEFLKGLASIIDSNNDFFDRFEIHFIISF